MSDLCGARFPTVVLFASQFLSGISAESACALWLFFSWSHAPTCGPVTGHLIEHPVGSTMVQGHLEKFTRNNSHVLCFFLRCSSFFFFFVPSTFLSGVSLTVFLFSFPFLFLILLGTWFCSL